MASNINPTTMWTPQGGYLDPSNYQQGGNVTYLDENGNPSKSPLNPYQFATDPTAQGIAENLGGTVRNDQLSGPGLGYVGADGKPITQAQIQTPGNPNAMNAGLVAQNFGKYGDAPGSMGQYNIAGNGSAPTDQTYAQYAMSQPGFKMDPLLGNSGPGYNFAFDPRSGTYTNTATGQAGITPTQATQQMQQANGVGGAGGAGAGSTPTGSQPDYSKGTYINGQWQTFTQPNLSSDTGSATGSATGTLAGPGAPGSTPSWVPKGFRLGAGGNLIPDNVANSGQTGQTGATHPNAHDPYTLRPPTQNVGDVWNPDQGTGQQNFGIPEGETPYSGFAPTSNTADAAPNNQYLSQQGNGNPLSYLRYNDPTQGPFNGQYGQPTAKNPGAVAPYTGGDISEMTRNNRNLALGEGAGLSQQLQNYTNFNAGQSADFQQQLASAYAPIASGHGGYTNEQMASILNEPALQALQQTPGQAQANFLTSDEQAGIMGDPYAAYRQLGSDEGALDSQQNMNASNIYDFMDAQQRDVNANTARTAGQVRNTYTNTGNNVNSALENEANSVNPYVDPTALNISSQYNQNYNFTPADEQAIREQAGRTVGNQELTDEQNLAQQANAQGNTSPLAIQAARDRLRQTGAVNEANAMSNAAIQARQLALNTTQNKEQTRLGAAQNYANLGTSTQENLGAQNVAAQQTLGAAQMGAEQYLGSQNQTAQLALGQSNLSNQQQLGTQGQQNAQYKATTNLAAGQQADTAASNRTAGIATNRQTTEQANQATQLARGQYIYGQNNSTNLGFANQTLQQQQEYRNYLQNQQTQANQNQTIGNQQQLGAYGQQTGAANTATAGAIANYGTKSGDSTDLTKLVLGNAEGGQYNGPVHALVGEAGPELILTFGHYGDGNSQKAWNGSSGNPEAMGLGGGGGMGDPNDYGVYNPQLPGLGGPTASPQQSQQAQQAQQTQQPPVQDPNSSNSQVTPGTTAKGAIKPKNNSIWNGIVSGLGTQQGALAGTYGGNTGAGSGSGILGSLLQAAQIYKVLKATQAAKGNVGSVGSDANDYSVYNNAYGGMYGMALGGTAAPTTDPPPQWPDVDSGVGGGQVEDGGTVASVGPPAKQNVNLPVIRPGGSPPRGGFPPGPTTQPAPTTPKTPPFNGGMRHLPPPPVHRMPSTYDPGHTEITMGGGNGGGNPGHTEITVGGGGAGGGTGGTGGGYDPGHTEITSGGGNDNKSGYDPGHTEIRMGGATGGGTGQPQGKQTSPYPYPPILMPGKLKSDATDSTVTYNPETGGDTTSTQPPTQSPGGLTGLGESSSTFTPDREDIIHTPGGEHGAPLTSPIVQPGSLTGPGTSETNITYPDRTPWTDPSAWIPGGYGGTPGITPSNPGTGAENHPSWWDSLGPITTSPSTGTGSSSSTITYTLPGSPGDPSNASNYDASRSPGTSPTVGNSGGDPGTVAGGSGSYGGGGGYAHPGDEDAEDNYALGGVIGNGHHPYGRKGLSKAKLAEESADNDTNSSAFPSEPRITRPKMPGAPKPKLPGLPKAGVLGMPKVQLVSKPTLMTLGKTHPQAVLPLVNRPGNKIHFSDIPALTEKYGGYGSR